MLLSLEKKEIDGRHFLTKRKFSYAGLAIWIHITLS